MQPDKLLGARGLQCPMPLLKTKLALRDLSPGQSLRVDATDSGSARDIPKYLERSEHELTLMSENPDGTYTFLITCGA